MRVAFQENDGNQEAKKTTKTTQTATNKELSAGLADVTGTTEMTRKTGSRVANHAFPKQQVDISED